MQNQQLTDELDYQSLQTEKVLIKNQQLENQLQLYKKELEIHKLVQHELINKKMMAEQSLVSRERSRSIMPLIETTHFQENEK